MLYSQKRARSYERERVAHLLESHEFGSVLYVPDGEILLTQLVHNIVVLWMIGSQHQKGVVTHLTEILQSLDTTKLNNIG